MHISEWCKAVLYGILEGVTEWLPISSTGHLILLEEYLPFRFCADVALLSAFWELFEVVIQLGAICAVLLLFWERLSPFSRGRDERQKRCTYRLWGKVLLASLPAAVVGVLLDRILVVLTQKDINGWLFCAPVVAFSLIAYGVVFLFSGRIAGVRRNRTASVDDITLAQALGIGAFQMLSLVPGTSRSGSTVLGAELLGLSRHTGAEFSFFMAIPVMLGASGIKVMGFWSYVATEGVSVPLEAWMLLLVGCVVSFAVSMISIRFLLDFVKRHSFVPFGVYRILLGAAVLLLRW